MNLEEQKEKILQKLDDAYGFGFIQEFGSLDVILDSDLPYNENVRLLRDYLSEELLITEHGKEIARVIGNDRYIVLKEDLAYGEFERLMTGNKH